MPTKSINDTLADMRARRRNPRVLVKEANRYIKSVAGSITARWETSLTTYDPVTENGRVINHRHRPKRPDELPENQPESWEILADYARSLAVVADELLTFAEKEKALAARRADDALRDAMLAPKDEEVLRG
jgi:hypothetical protein